VQVNVEMPKAVSVREDCAFSWIRHLTLRFSLAFCILFVAQAQSGGQLVHGYEGDAWLASRPDHEQPVHPQRPLVDRPHAGHRIARPRAGQHHAAAETRRKSRPAF
jgi:hypothetical protein